MRKFTLGLTALLVLFTANTFAQDAEGCGIPTLTIDKVITPAFDPSIAASTSGQSFEFTEDTLLDSVTYEFQYSDLVTSGATHVQIEIGEMEEFFGTIAGFASTPLVTSAIFEIPTSGSGTSPIITVDFSASSITLDANTLYAARLVGFTSAAGAGIGARVEVRTSQNDDYADGSFYRTVSGVDAGIADQMIDVYFELVASGIQAPDNATTSTVADTTADFSWDGEANTTYEAKVIANGGDPDVDTDLGSTMVSGATASATGLTAETSYDFYVRGLGDCSSIARIGEWSLVDFTTATLSTDTFSLSNVSIYPNPTISTLNISGLEKDNLNVSVFNILGSKILETTKSEINVSALNTGIYLIKIETNNGSVTKRFIKK